MERSCFTVDLGAIRRNAETLLRAAGGAELWAVVKAEGYGHGAVDISRAALDAGASALCVATLPEALHLRAALRNARIIVMCPVSEREIGEARAARLELVAADGRVPEGVRVHLKLDTGMGRWGLSELPTPTRDVVGVMSHLASAESDPAFTQLQVERFKEATARPRLADEAPRQQRGHAALRGGALRRRSLWHRALRHLAVRRRSAGGRARACLALGVVSRAREAARARREHGVRASIRRRSTDVDRHRSRRVRGRVSARHDRHRDPRRRRSVGASSARSRWMRSRSSWTRDFALGTPVTLVGDGILIEDHARVADTIGYEIATGLNTRSGRARRVAKDG